MNEPKISKAEALYEAWKRGFLSWKLDTVQKELYQHFYTNEQKTQVWLLSRRSGKTYALLVLALEQCFKVPNSIVKFVSPTKLQVNTNVRPVIKELLADCPEELKPRYSGKDYIYYFPNGSEIQLAGTDGGHAEKLRGQNSHLALIDEAGSCDDLENVIKNILLPTTLITKGKIILAGTPPANAEHTFCKYVEQAESRKTLFKKTVFDNPRLSKEQVEELIAEMGGLTSEACRRELLVEILRDEKSHAIPEFTDELQKEIVKEWPLPPFFETYESMDLGFKDLTVVLFAYYDFRADKIIIQDELILNFNEKDENISTLIKKIKDKEKLLWTNYLTDEIKKPLVRVSDINYIVTNEIRVASQGTISFNAAKKDDKEAAVNNIRMLLGNKKIIIHPRCETLIRHLKNVKWNSNKSQVGFARSLENYHYDAVDALLFLPKVINYKKNPYPSNYEVNLNDIYYVNKKDFNTQKNQTLENNMKTIFGIKNNNQKFKIMSTTKKERV